LSCMGPWAPGDVPEGVTPRLEIPEEYIGLVSPTDRDWSFPTCAVVGHSGLLRAGPAPLLP
jgi:hypothetical protein